MQLFREILKRIVYQRDSSGKIIEQRAAASSIKLPAIDEQSTREQMALLMRELLETNDVESVQRQLRNAVCAIKELYTQTHGGFSQPQSAEIAPDAGRQTNISHQYLQKTACQLRGNMLPLNKSLKSEVTMANARTSREKMQRYRERLRAAGLRPVQVWVPDTTAPGFAEEARRQSLLVSSSSEEQGVLDFIEANADLEEWQ